MAFMVDVLGFLLERPPARGSTLRWDESMGGLTLGLTWRGKGWSVCHAIAFFGVVSIVLLPGCGTTPADQRSSGQVVVGRGAPETRYVERPVRLVALGGRKGVLQKLLFYSSPSNRTSRIAVRRLGGTRLRLTVMERVPRLISDAAVPKCALIPLRGVGAYPVIIDGPSGRHIKKHSSERIRGLPESVRRRAFGPERCTHFTSEGRPRRRAETAGSIATDGVRGSQDRSKPFGRPPG